MKAIQLSAKGVVPAFVDMQEPQVKEGFHKLRVSYAALNHRDNWIVKGQYAGLKYPIVLGSDACGYYENARYLINPGFYWGENPKSQSKSFQILGLPEDGSFAEYVNVPIQNLIKAPEYLEDAQAAALGLAGVTAYRALITKCQPQKGERLLVTGIGGGVALYVLQMAKSLGLEVYITTSSEIKLNKAKSMGAIDGVLYTSENWEQKLLELNPAGFDLIVDGFAGNSVHKLVKLVNAGGRICFYGGTGGKIQDLVPQQLFWKQISLLGSTMGSPVDFSNFINLVNETKLIPVIDSIYNLSDANQAFQRMENSEQFGKIVLKVNAL